MQVAVDTHEFKMVGPPPQKFAVGDGMLIDIATAALPALLRLGTGALNIGGLVLVSTGSDGKQLHYVSLYLMFLAQVTRLSWWKMTTSEWHTVRLTNRIGWHL